MFFMSAEFGQQPNDPHGGAVTSAGTGHWPPPRTVSGPYRSPVARSTEHDVWKLMVVPLIETVLSASKEPWMVNWPPSVTDLDWPFMVTVALAGKLLVREP